VSVALANLPTTRLERLPRLADLATWVVAAEPALPWTPGAFLAAYSGNREDANDLALEASPIVPALRQIDAFTGSATELLALLATKADDETKRQRAWPKSAHGLSNVLRRLASNLRASGIDVDFLARERSRRVLSISRRETQEDEPEETGNQRHKRHKFPSPCSDAPSAVTLAALWATLVTLGVTLPRLQIRAQVTLVTLVTAFCRVSRAGPAGAPSPGRDRTALACVLAATPHLSPRTEQRREHGLDGRCRNAFGVREPPRTVLVEVSVQIRTTSECRAVAR